MRPQPNEGMNILIDNQSPLSSLTNLKITSRLVWECREELKELVNRYRVILYWVPGCPGITGNDKSDECTRHGSSTPYVSLEHAH